MGSLPNGAIFWVVFVGINMSLPFLGPTAGILVIGEEILSAKVEEENARYLVRELRGLGVAVRRIDVIPDEIDEIAEAVRGMSSRYDHVFTSGGVGPTHDDVTMAAIAKAFGLRPARNLELEAKIRSAMGPDLHERDLRMADIPDGARLLYGPDGDRSHWPVVTVRNVYILPGVPEIFRYKFAMVRELFRTGPILSRAVYSSESEAVIAATLDAVVAEFPGVAVGSYPRLNLAEYKVKITVDGRDAAAVERATARLVEGLGAAVVRTE
jgi:molybdenum cofactor synthesis domain-containing protein